MAASADKFPQVTRLLRRHELGSSSSLHSAHSSHIHCSGVQITKLKSSENDADSHHSLRKKLNAKLKKQQQNVTPTKTICVEEVQIDENNSRQQPAPSPQVTRVQKLRNKSSIKVHNGSDLSNTQLAKVNQACTDKLEFQTINHGTDDNEQHISVTKVRNWLGHEQPKQVLATPTGRRAKQKIENDGNIYKPPSVLSMSTTTKSVLLDEKHQTPGLSTPRQIHLKHHHFLPMNSSVKPTDSLPSSRTPRMNLRAFSNINIGQLPASDIADKESLTTRPWWKKSHIRCCCWHGSPWCCFLLGLLILLCVAGAITAGILVPKMNTGKSTQTTINSATVNTAVLSINNSTTTAPCIAGYSRAPSGICVNIQIDINNCGSFGHVCSSNYTSCSAGVCSKAPAVQLVGAISIFNLTGIGIDDAFLTVHLPLSITLYNYSTSTVSVTSNGVVCLGSCSSDYTNGNLPTSSFPGPTALGYWDDLYLQSNTSQNIYYAVSGTAPSRTTTFEFYTTHYSQFSEYYHFQVLFYENLPNIVKYVYFEATDGGVSATIGVQKSSAGPSVTYSVNQASSVTSNLTLIFDTNLGTVTG